MIPTTAVISPRGHESSWSRMTIQSRMIGAAAAASSSQRRIEKVSKAETASRDAVDVRVAVVRVGLYHGRNTPTASNSPPTAAMISERLMRRRSIGRATLTVC